MSAITITKQVAQLRTLFNKVASVFFVATPGIAPDNIETLDFALPILEDSVTFNTGEPSVETVDLTTGEKWTTMTTAGDPDITMNVASFDAGICELFLEKIEGADGSLAGLDGKTYRGAGYSFAAKKVVGGLLLRSEDGNMVIYMPHVEIYSSMAVEENVPGYFNMQITPLAAENGVAVYIMGLEA